MRSSTGLAGGVGETRHMCGAILGGVLAIGLRHGRVDRGVSRQMAVDRVADLVGAFRQRFGSVICADLVHGFRHMAEPGRKEHCARLVDFVGDWITDGFDGGGRA